MDSKNLSAGQSIVIGAVMLFAILSFAFRGGTPAEVDKTPEKRVRVEVYEAWEREDKVLREMCKAKAMTQLECSMASRAYAKERLGF